MRIEKLHMKNFAPIFVALDKTEVTLDYTKMPTKMINIFIGQMGSCKTFLLGHHQPYATLGTLDVRNSEDMILEGKQGIKEIVFRNGDDLFEITHVYSPTKTSHTVKSYIKKNGVELNENGNNGSFKAIIETDFGMDQNFLKLFRIGSNVVNLPDMTATERKSFISSMLTETEIYTMLYRKIGEEHRSLNAQTTILINRLHMISNRSLDQLQADAEVEAEIAKDTQEKIDEKTKDRYRLEGMITSLRGGLDAQSYLQQYIHLQESIKSIDLELGEKLTDLESVKDQPDPNELGQQIARVRAQLDIRTSQMSDLQRRIEEDTEAKNRITDQIAVIGSKEHVDQLRATYNGLMHTLEGYERQLQHFTYTGSVGSIVSLTSELENLHAMIIDVAQYDAEAVKAILRNKRGALFRAEREVARAKSERDKLQAEMSNISAVTTYTTTHTMVRPFNCPTKDCPYYKYHPLTEQRENRNKNVDKIFLEKRNHVKKLEATIYLYEDYPNIARKLDNIKAIWKSLYEEASSLGILLEDDLGEIITNLMHRQWYDQNRLQRIKELCGIRAKYYELMEQVASMRNSLTKYEVTDVDKLHADLDAVSTRLVSELTAFEEMEDANNADRTELDRLDALYLKLSSIEETKRQILALQTQSQSLHADLVRYEENMAKIDDFTSEITELKTSLSSLTEQYRVHSRSLESINRKITDIKSTTAQYEDTLKRKQLIQDILNAVSSKNGIPLAFVKLFLADCKDALNNLIADVFDDAIEIQDFVIPEDGTEFNIPYTRNGTLIDDINKSSQGERAIISLALSFALIRQRSFNYNIILLDEVDGPLHKDSRNKFLTILFKQLQAINAEQVFIVSHNNTFDGYNVNIIRTTPELVDENPLTAVMSV